MAAIGFIGIGNMGGPMARNLLATGHDVRVFDLSRGAMAALAEAGAGTAKSAADAASGAEFVVTMLPAGAQVRRVWLDDGALAASEAGAVLIDSSTIDVATAKDLHRAAAAAGRAMLDAPVSGGTGGARAGTLTFMAGGAADEFARAAPVLRGMGANLVHCGGPGMGQAAKICNNMVAGISIVAISEMFVMGERLGLDRQTLFDVVTNSSGDCWALRHACPVPGPVPDVPSAHGYAPGFAAALMLKDLRLAQEAAATAGTAAPLGAAAAALFALHVNNGHGERDLTSIVEMLAGPEQEGG